MGKGIEIGAWSKGFTERGVSFVQRKLLRDLDPGPVHGQDFFENYQRSKTCHVINNVKTYLTTGAKIGI